MWKARGTRLPFSPAYRPGSWFASREPLRPALLGRYIAPTQGISCLQQSQTSTSQQLCSGSWILGGGWTPLNGPCCRGDWIQEGCPLGSNGWVLYRDWTACGGPLCNISRPPTSSSDGSIPRRRLSQRRRWHPIAGGTGSGPFCIVSKQSNCASLGGSGRTSQCWCRPSLGAGGPVSLDAGGVSRLPGPLKDHPVAYLSPVLSYHPTSDTYVTSGRDMVCYGTMLCKGDAPL